VSFLDEITVLVLTYNEAQNIERTLTALSRFRYVVVLDSGSNDETAAIVESFANTRLVTRPFDTHSNQWNFGINECGIETPWVLALDADYNLPKALVDEISNLVPGQNVGYEASFDYSVFGRLLKGTLYPPVTVLFRKEAAHYVQGGHTQRLQTNGELGRLRTRIIHDDRKPLSRWFVSQQKYAKLEADFLFQTPKEKLRFTDRLRRSGWPTPIIILIYTLLVNRCIFDGWAGWYYALQRMIAEGMIAAEVLDRRLRDRQEDKSLIQPVLTHKAYDIRV